MSWSLHTTDSHSLCELRGRVSLGIVDTVKSVDKVEWEEGEWRRGSGRRGTGRRGRGRGKAVGEETLETLAHPVLAFSGQVPPPSLQMRSLHGSQRDGVYAEGGRERSRGD